MQQLREKLKKDLRITTLEDVADIIMGQSPPSASYNKDGDGLPFLQGKTDFSNSKKYPIIRQWTSAPTKISESGSILFTVRAPVGELFYNNVKACIGRGLASISAKSNNSQEFLYQFLQSKKAEFDKLSQGSTFTAINSDALRKIKIAVPSLKEQKKIAEVLSKVDEDIEKTNEIIRETKKLKNSLMQELFTEGIGNTEFKRKKLGELCNLNYGKDRKKAGDGNAYGIYGTSGIIGYSDKFLYDKPSVLIGRKGTIDKPFFVENPFWVVDTVFYTTNFVDVLPKWLFYLMNTISLKKYNEATGVPSLNKNTLEKIEFNVPSLDVQDKIVTVLSKIDEKIDVYKAIKNKLGYFKKGLMQDLLVS